MPAATQHDPSDALLLMTLSEAAYIDERPLPGESIAQQEARMLLDIDASLERPYPGWSVTWGPKLNADRSNMMYIAGNPSSKQYAAVVRGTDWWFLLDWLEDFSSVLGLVPYTYFPGAAANIALGTSTGLEQLIGMGPAAYLASVADGATIFVTGHSLGGCLASALAPYLARSLPGPGPASLQVYTFAAPSAGDAGFAAAYNALFGPAGGPPAAFRFYNTLDAVPNGWASLPTIESYYQPLPQCPQDFKDVIDDALGMMSGGGIEYVQVGDASNGTAIELPGHLLLARKQATSAIDPIGDAMFLYEVGLQHGSSNYLSLLGGEPVQAPLAKLRGRLGRPGRPSSSGRVTS